MVLGRFRSFHVLVTTLIILELKADNDLAIQTTDILKVCQNMKTRENDQKNSKEKEKFPMAGVPDRKVTALSIDCLQSAFFLKSIQFLSQPARLQTTMLRYNKGLTR